METSLGTLQIELFQDKAPISVKNFLEYVNAGFYNGLLFHRVIPKFMVQGGGFDVNMKQPATRPPIKNEAKNGVKNLRGTLAMARTSDVDSATAQFFINVVDNAFLDNGPKGFGYAVFGKVTQGMDVVDKICAVLTKNVGMYENVPEKPVQIVSAKVKK
jgi:peptidyl-prolyl cis-trans isomerase A (cyclophilin A)